VALVSHDGGIDVVITGRPNGESNETEDLARYVANVTGKGHEQLDRSKKKHHTSVYGWTCLSECYLSPTCMLLISCMKCFFIEKEFYFMYKTMCEKLMSVFEHAPFD